jgi:hypothetical protein
VTVDIDENEVVRLIFGEEAVALLPPPALPAPTNSPARASPEARAGRTAAGSGFCSRFTARGRPRTPRSLVALLCRIQS